MRPIIIKGLTINNLKNVDLTLPEEQIIVFTGVSGSGKSSIVFDTIAAESQRQMNETYPAFVRSRMKKYEKPQAECILNLRPSVVIDQSRLGGNARSTVGTISDMYAALRLLYSRIGEPHIGSASAFSFNDPSGMCKTCCGLGKIITLNLDAAIHKDKSLNEGMLDLPSFGVGNWYWKQYVQSGLFDCDKPFCEYSEREKNILFYGSETQNGVLLNKKIEGIYNFFNRLVVNKDHSGASEGGSKRFDKYTCECTCPDCGGKRLCSEVMNCKIGGYSIDQMCEMEFSELVKILQCIKTPCAQTIIQNLIDSLQRMIDIGLPYLSMNRESSTLSGGEAQRLKLVRYMGSSLTGMFYIFDEPSTGMHPRDVHRMTKLLQSLRDKGNTVLVVEHDRDVISLADQIVDVGPGAGQYGGQIVFQGSYNELLNANTLTGRAMQNIIPIKQSLRRPTGYLPIRNANIHNLKDINVDIPTGILTCVTGVAGSGKSSLIRDVFAKQYAERVVLVDQSPITATGRSTPATFLGVFDDIRKCFARDCGVDESLLSFNSKGGCSVCGGRGYVTTELAYMDPVTTTCEACGGTRYCPEALSCKYHGKNIVEVLELSASASLEFFSGHKKITKSIQSMIDVGLPYLSLGQPLSTLSGGERQRLKLSHCMGDKGNIYVLDEPTTGLHASDILKIMELLESIVERGNTVIVIEHNTDVMKQADYIIDIGPDGGTAGGQLVFAGTPAEMLNADTITAHYLRMSLAVS